mmetsp:Transcript_27552/g.43358  ORF Transcript_27552/g.43358 Transcript_27552/m.43358 type:complete len:82 (-) Transcript_27552:170-415(-)
MGSLALDLLDDTVFRLSSVSLICGLNSVGGFNPSSAMTSLSEATTSAAWHGSGNDVVKEKLNRVTEARETATNRLMISWNV